MVTTDNPSPASGTTSPTSPSPGSLHGQAALDLALVPGQVLGRQAVVGDAARDEVAEDLGRVRTVQHQLRQLLQQRLEPCTDAAEGVVGGTRGAQIPLPLPPP